MERLKAAIEKASAARARAVRDGGLPPDLPPGPGLPPGFPGPAPAATAAAPGPAPGPWESLREVTLAPRQLARSRIVSLEKSDPAHVAFDVLRTRVLKALRDNGWRRVAVTSPTKGCGKTFVAANLALSLARQPEIRTLLLDLDLRAPALAPALGLREARPIQPFLEGRAAPAEHLLRVGANLALGPNSQRVRDSAELIQARQTGPALAAAVAFLAPDVVILDLPPLLAGDDALATLPHVDCALLVAGGGQTTPEHIEACERLLEGSTPLLGVVLNRAEDVAEDLYGYG